MVVRGVVGVERGREGAGVVTGVTGVVGAEGVDVGTVVLDVTLADEVAGD